MSEYIVKTVPVSLQEVDCLDFSDLVLTYPPKVWARSSRVRKELTNALIFLVWF